MILTGMKRLKSIGEKERTFITFSEEALPKQ